MKVIAFLAEAWEEKMLRDALPGHEIVSVYAPLTHATVPEVGLDAEIVTLFVDSVFDADMLEKFPNVKMIATRSTGYDHIDLAACQARGIVVSNVPTYGANTVAEHAFALLLCLSKRIFDGYEQVREGRGYNPHSLRGFDLAGRTLGVVGTGNIGRHAVNMGKGFGMQVIAYDAFPNDVFAKEAGFRYRTLNELLAEADVITIHVPYMPATHHLLNRDNMESVKDGVVIINTSRGAVMETEALVAGLASGKIYGAGLDVFEEEGPIKDELHFMGNSISPDGQVTRTLLANHVLIDHPNVIVTPHSAFNTDEALRRIINTSIDNMTAFIKGEPINTVSAS